MRTMRRSLASKLLEGHVISQTTKRQPTIRAVLDVINPASLQMELCYCPLMPVPTCDFVLVRFHPYK